jgi:hypothetical protein
MVGGEVGWRKMRWKLISKLFAEERAEKAIMERIRKQEWEKRKARESRV